jgi:exopolysaccharide biosynthesis operon protein EpsL
VTPRRSAQRRASLWFRIAGSTIAVAGLFLPAMEAFALWDDKLTLFAEEKATHDDNVFRISKDVDPASISSSSRGDTYRTTSLGFNLDTPVSRQRFQVGYTWIATRYNQFTDLDSDGHDARAIWLWQLGNDASGQLGYTETSTLASFAYIQARTLDLLKTRQAFLNAAYLVTPRWRVRTGVSELEQTNSDTARRINDVSLLSAEMAVSYVTPGSTSVGLSTRVEDGRFPNREVVVGSPFDNAYRQYSGGIVADWTVSGVSYLSARADRVSRRYAQRPQGDFDGNTAHAEYDWKPTGKFWLAATVRRDISPYQDIQSSFVLVKGLTLRPKLSVTEKIDVSGVFDYSNWYYLGDPGLVSGGVQGRRDRVRSAAATVSYKPARTVTFLMSGQHENRFSSVAFADYVVNVVSITARITF